MPKTNYSQRISGGTRLYYIDACTDRNGEAYLSISEIPTRGKGKRQHIYIYSRDIDKFAAALAEVTNYMKEKEDG